MHYFTVDEAPGEVSGFWVLAKQGELQTQLPQEQVEGHQDGELRVVLVGQGDAGKLETLVPTGLQGRSVFWCGGDGDQALELFMR